MRILFFGDIVGKVGRNAIKHYIDKLVEKHQIDFVIANGENVTHGKGLIEKHYNELLDDGIDVITLGNHYKSKHQIFDYIDDADCLVRPINVIKDIGGTGSLLLEHEGIKIRVTNILGTAFMDEEVVQPYQALKDLLDSIGDEDSIHIVDYHAEATGEKIAFAYVFDGAVSAIIGTHTHVQTNDAKILDNGTGFMCDVGMCGAYNGVLGFEKSSVINKTIFGQPTRFTVDENAQEMINAVVLDIDNDTKRCKEIFPVKILGEKNGK